MAGRALGAAGRAVRPYGERSGAFLSTHPHAVAAGAGFLTAIASYRGQLVVADLALFLLALAVWRRPPAWAWALALPVALSAIWGANHWYPVWVGLRLLSLATVMRGIDPRFAGAGLGAGLLLQTALLPLLAGAVRPSALSSNPSVLGQAGLALFLLLPEKPRGRLGNFVPWYVPVVLIGASAALTIGVSQARAAVLAAGAWTALRRGRLTTATFIGVLLVTAVSATVTHGVTRLSFEGLNASLDSRVAIGGVVDAAGTLGLPPGRQEFIWARGVDAARAEAGSGALSLDPPVEERHYALVDAQFPYRAPSFSLLGYGYDSFLERTNTQRPHIVPVLAAYELGLFAVPLLALAAWALWTRRVPWALAVSLGLLWLLTEEAWSSGAGHWMTALVVAALAVPATRRPLPRLSWRRLPLKLKRQKVK